MKRLFKEDGKLVFHKRTDPTNVLNSAERLRALDKDAPQFAADWRHVGRLDKHVVEMWLKEAGVKWDDQAAVREVIKKNLMDSNYAQFRVWEGSY